MYITTRATTSQGVSLIIPCNLPTIDVTPPQGRAEPSYAYSSNTEKLFGSVQVHDDSPILDNAEVAIGLGEGALGYHTVAWTNFSLAKSPINEEAEGHLKSFTSSKLGKLATAPAKALQTMTDSKCAEECVKFGEECISFNFHYVSHDCWLYTSMESQDIVLADMEQCYYYERLGIGHSAWFGFHNLSVIHGISYIFNIKIQNDKGFISFLHSKAIMVDFTTPDPGDIGLAELDILQHDNCSAAVTHWERCVEVTSIPNHR